MFDGEDRGQSVQVGAILLFGMLVLSLSFYQAFVIPQNNKEVEFNGYVDASDDMEELRNDLLAAGTRGSQSATTVSTGVRYPARTVFVNPGPPAGRLEATPPARANVTFDDNVVAVSGEADNTRAFWNLTKRPAAAGNVSTRFVRFSPAYNTIDVPPVVATGSGVYRMADGGPISLTGHSLVSGNRITLVTVDGDLSRSGLSTPVTAQPSSVATRSVVITGRDDQDFTLSMPVPGNATQWNASDAAERIHDHPHVSAVARTGYVDLTFDGEKQWELRMARVLVHERGDSGVDAATDPAYLVALDNETAVPAQGTRRVAVEVRDRYNNPVSGANVSFEVLSGGTFDVGGQPEEMAVRTDGEGRATVPFNLTDSATKATINVEVVDEGVPPYNATTMVLFESGSAGGDGAGTGTDDINPSEDGDVQLEYAEKGSSHDIDVVFNNTGLADQQIQKLRISFYYADQADKRATEMEISGTTFSVPGATNGVTATFPANSESTLGIDITDTVGNKGVTVQGDFFIMTVWFDGAGKQTYFVAVTK